MKGQNVWSSSLSLVSYSSLITRTISEFDTKTVRIKGGYVEWVAKKECHTLLSVRRYSSTNGKKVLKERT